jgi:ATP-binding cassette, subfamily B, bacterial
MSAPSSPGEAHLPPAYWFLWRLVRFRPWLWGLNLVAITALIVVAMAPGLISQAFFDRLPGRLQGSASVPAATWLGLPEWLWWLCLFTVLSTGGRIICAFGCQLTNGPFMFEGAALLQTNLLARVLQLPGARSLPASSGEAISRFREDADETPGFMMGFNDMIGAAAFAVIALAIMLRIDAVITLLVFLPLAAVVAVVNRARTNLDRYRRASREATGDVTGYIGETMGAVQAIQVASAESHIVEHFRTLNARRLGSAVRDRVFDQLLASVFWNTVNLGTGAILLLAGRKIQTGEFTIGDFALFSFFLGFATDMTTELGRVLSHYKRLDVSFGRMSALLVGAPAQIMVKPAPLYVRQEPPPLPQPRREAVDRLERLDVAGLVSLYPGPYPGGAAGPGRGIRDVSLALRRGTLTVVTGRVGAGKTTLLQAVLGLQHGPGRGGTLERAPGRRSGDLVRATPQRLRSPGATPVQRELAGQPPARADGPAGGPGPGPTPGRPGGRRGGDATGIGDAGGTARRPPLRWPAAASSGRPDVRAPARAAGLRRPLQRPRRGDGAVAVDADLRRDGVDRAGRLAPARRPASG